MKEKVWKHRPNWLLYALMLRTKFQQKPFFFTGHQNVNKSNSRIVRTVYGPIFLPFNKNIVSFFSFSVKMQTRSNCAIIGRNLPKNHKLTLYKTQNRGPNYVDHKFFITFCQELPQKNLGIDIQILQSWLVDWCKCCVTLRLHNIKKLQCLLNTP